MNRHLIRFFALVLIPCLIADPVTATALAPTTVRTEPAKACVFDAEAITPPDSGSRWQTPFSVLLTALVLTMIAPVRVSLARHEVPTKGRPTYSVTAPVAGGQRILSHLGKLMLPPAISPSPISSMDENDRSKKYQKADEHPGINPAQNFPFLATLLAILLWPYYLFRQRGFARRLAQVSGGVVALVGIVELTDSFFHISDLSAAPFGVAVFQITLSFLAMMLGSAFAGRLFGWLSWHLFPSEIEGMDELFQLARLPALKKILGNDKTGPLWKKIIAIANALPVSDQLTFYELLTPQLSGLNAIFNTDGPYVVERVIDILTTIPPERLMCFMKWVLPAAARLPRGPDEYLKVLSSLVSRHQPVTIHTADPPTKILRRSNDNVYGPIALIYGNENIGWDHAAIERAHQSGLKPLLLVDYAHLGPIEKTHPFKAAQDIAEHEFEKIGVKVLPHDSTAGAVTAILDLPRYLNLTNLVALEGGTADGVLGIIMSAEFPIKRAVAVDLKHVAPLLEANARRNGVAQDRISFIKSDISDVRAKDTGPVDVLIMNMPVEDILRAVPNILINHPSIKAMVLAGLPDTHSNPNAEFAEFEEMFLEWVGFSVVERILLVDEQGRKWKSAIYVRKSDIDPGINSARINSIEMGWGATHEAAPRSSNDRFGPQKPVQVRRKWFPNSTRTLVSLVAAIGIALGSIAIYSGHRGTPKFAEPSKLENSDSARASYPHPQDDDLISVEEAQLPPKALQNFKQLKNLAHDLGGLQKKLTNSPALLPLRSWTSQREGIIFKNDGITLDILSISDGQILSVYGTALDQNLLSFVITEKGVEVLIVPNEQPAYLLYLFDQLKALQNDPALPVEIQRAAGYVADNMKPYMSKDPATRARLKKLLALRRIHEALLVKPDNPSATEVFEGQFSVIQAQGMLKTWGANSCVILTLYDPSTKTALLAHIDVNKHIPTIVDQMLDKLNDVHANRKRLKASVFTQTGRETLLSIEEELAKRGIPIQHQDVLNGGSPKSIMIDTTGGIYKYWETRPSTPEMQLKASGGYTAMHHTLLFVPPRAADKVPGVGNPGTAVAPKFPKGEPQSDRLRGPLEEFFNAPLDFGAAVVVPFALSFVPTHRSHTKRYSSSLQDSA